MNAAGRNHALHVVEGIGTERLAVFGEVNVHGCGRFRPEVIAIFAAVRSVHVTYPAMSSGGAIKLRYIKAARNPGLPLRGASFTLQRLEALKKFSSGFLIKL
jgi:hypothetical protein